MPLDAFDPCLIVGLPSDNQLHSRLENIPEAAILRWFPRSQLYIPIHIPFICYHGLMWQSQRYILYSLHKALCITTLYYKSCTMDQQYYFVLQSLHFKWHTPLGTRRLHSQHATRSGTRHSKWHTPLEVAHATRSGTRHSKWHTPLEVAHATRSGIRHSKWHTPLEVAWSGKIKIHHICSFSVYIHIGCNTGQSDRFQLNTICMYVNLYIYI